jgi:hypothetical protein
MAAVDNSAQGIIERAFSSQPDGTYVSGVRLLRLFADASLHFIGELGFATMLFRCAQVVVAEFPWIPTDARVERGMRQLSRIDSIIEGQDPVQARCARIGLLNCFVDFLTLMIGESATVLILHQAFDRPVDAPTDSRFPE